MAKYSYLADGSKSKAENGSGVGLVYRGSLIYRKAANGTLTLEGAGIPEGRLTVNGVRWYVQDHLRSVRAVVDGATGNLLAVTDYEAYGEDTANSAALSYLSPAPAGETFRDRFTGKEDQGPDFGTAYTDFGARQYSPALRRWLVPDPLSEKYYGVSPYAYCAGDPVNMVDEDGRDGMVKGDGTKNNPYTIVAVYLYDSSITQDQLDGLNAAIADYNNSCTRVKDKTGNIVYVTFDLSSRLSENPKEERLSFNFKDEHGNPRYYGNIVTVEEDCESERYGYATMMEIGFSEGLIGLGIEKGMNPSSLYKGVAIHEIGHNLGGEHEDGTSVMQLVEEYIINSQDSYKRRSEFNYPSFSKSFVKRVFNRRDTPRVDGNARIWTKY